MTLAEMVAAGWSSRQIACALRIDKTTAWRKAQAYGGCKGVRGRHTGLPPEPEDEPTQWAPILPADFWRFTDEPRAARSEPAWRSVPATYRPSASSAQDVVNA